MKHAITILCLFFATGAFAQSKQPQQKSDTANYHIIGKISDFELLYLYLKSPGDVTPNQKTGLTKWVEELRPVGDTVKIKK